MLRFVAVLLAISFIVLWEEISFRTHVPPAASQGHNAVWLRHSWVGERHTEAEYRDLARLLTGMEMSDVYVHVGPLRADGSIDQGKVRAARDFIRRMKKLAPDVRLQAWLGQVERRGGGPLDISSAKTRSGIIRTARWLLDLGFDGVHYDIEPVFSANADFVALLKDTHALTQKRGAILSVAASKPEMLPGIVWVSGIVASNPGYWSGDYFLEVAREVDQVAVMTYDTGIPLPGLYGRDIAAIVQWSVAHGIDDLLIDVPTYDKGSPAHMRHVENVPNAIRGLQKGVGRMDLAHRRKVGAAVYAEWTTSPSEWREFKRWWVTSD